MTPASRKPVTRYGAASVLLLTSALWLAFPGGAPTRAASNPAAKLSPALAASLAQGDVPLLVYFAGQPDLSGASAHAPGSARRRFVYDLLRSQAAQSQRAARALLERAGAPVRQYYLLNMLETRSGAALAQSLAALPEVSRLAPIVPVAAHLPPAASTDSAVRPLALASVEWGVQRIHAPEVWSTYGVRGEGIVLGIADTGVQWDHPALKPQYRGWNGVSADHTYSWHDAIYTPTISSCGYNLTVPCDDLGHGTHVTGIAAGDDGGANRIGVAPGAKWIACRNMDHGDGTIPRYAECFQFMLAPYPQNGDPLTDGHPELGADIVNNSWTCTIPEGCDVAHLNDLQSSVQNLVSAGILVVAAAGNAGSQCSSVNQPIGIYAQTFSVGAVISGTDEVASFSSRGPVTVDGSNRRKPDISAPGVLIRSSWPISTYATINGTSMASPHVAGAAALLWSAVPVLTGNISETVSLLNTTADPRTTAQGCGGDSGSAVPNNVYGHGIVNVLAAIQAAALTHPTRTIRLFLPLYIR